MNPFEYTRASSMEDAVKKGATGSATKYLGGGTNLIDLVKYGVERPTKLVDVTHLPYYEVEVTKDGLKIGAGVKNSDLAANPHVIENYPVLSQALLSGASPQLRNLASTGGNLLQRTRCYYFYDTGFPCNKRIPGSGCPAISGINRIHAILGQSSECIAVHPSDMAVAMAALEARIHTRGLKGDRTIPISDLHRLPGDHPEIDTNLLPGELIVAVELPSEPIAKNSTYIKVRDRNSYAFALVSVAAALDLQEGSIKGARLAMGGVAHKPWRALDAEKLLIGKPPTIELFRSVADVALAGAKGYEHNDFKIELAKRTIVRAFSNLTGVEA